jgi:hypothetical protein
MPNPKTGQRGPPLVCCPLMLTQCIHSYSPHLEIIFTIFNMRTHHAVVTRDILNVPFLDMRRERERVCARACVRVFYVR